MNSNGFSGSNDVTQIVNFPSQIPGCDANSPAFLDLFVLFFDSRLLGVDTGCVQHQFTDFGDADLGMPKFNLK